MDTNDIVFSATFGFILGAIFTNLRAKRRSRRMWVRQIFQNRQRQGDYHNLIQEMRLQDTEMFFNYTRMTVATYDKLLSLVGPSLKKRSWRALNPDHRLLLTLRFLATGDSLRSISFAFRIAPSTACKIIHETCRQLWQVLQPLYMKQCNAENVRDSSIDFQNLWNMPNCFGAIDGKHVKIQAPDNSGSLFYNYKHDFSIVLLAVCDANYCFTMVDIGAYGAQSDGGVFNSSVFGQQLLKGNFNLPNATVLPGTRQNFPYYMVGDEAFPLKSFLMRPFGGKHLSQDKEIFNYRLSRARRVIENAFGVLASRWRIYRRAIIAKPVNIDNIVQATVCLHNFLRTEESVINVNDRKYCPLALIDQEVDGTVCEGEWRGIVGSESAFQNCGRLGSNNATKQAFKNRDILTTYFMSLAGEVPWQYDYINRGKILE